jgi:hypothetical protein
MADPYLLQSLELAGFRAYLQPKTFDFTKKRCLAIIERGKWCQEPFAIQHPEPLPHPLSSKRCRTTCPA